MPAASKSQFKYIQMLRTRYGSKAETPDEHKWVWEGDWTHGVKYSKLPDSVEKSASPSGRKIAELLRGGGEAGARVLRKLREYDLRTRLSDNAAHSKFDAIRPILNSKGRLGQRLWSAFMPPQSFHPSSQSSALHMFKGETAPAQARFASDMFSSAGPQQQLRQVVGDGLLVHAQPKPGFVPPWRTMENLRAPDAKALRGQGDHYYKSSPYYEAVVPRGNTDVVGRFFAPPSGKDIAGKMDNLLRSSEMPMDPAKHLWRGGTPSETSVAAMNDPIRHFSAHPEVGTSYATGREMGAPMAALNASNLKSLRSALEKRWEPYLGVPSVGDLRAQSQAQFKRLGL